MMIGITNIYEFGLVSFEYAEGTELSYRNVNEMSQPLVGRTYDFLNLALPAIFSFAVKINPSMFFSFLYFVLCITYSLELAWKLKLIVLTNRLFFKTALVIVLYLTHFNLLITANIYTCKLNDMDGGPWPISHRGP